MSHNPLPQNWGPVQIEANQLRLKPIGDRESGVLGVDADGEMIRLFVREDVRARKRELTAAERRDHERWPTFYSRDFAYTLHL